MIKVHDAYGRQKHNSLFENISKLISINSLKMNFNSSTKSSNIALEDQKKNHDLNDHNDKNKNIDHINIDSEMEKFKLLRNINKGFRQTLLHADERLKIAEIMYTSVKLLSSRLEEDLLAIEEERRIELELGIYQEELLLEIPPSSIMENEIKFSVNANNAKYGNSMRKKRKVPEPPSIVVKKKKNEKEVISSDLEKNPIAPPTIIFNPNGQGISEILEPKYCICNESSFGDMIACDNENCSIEWFHCQCVGISDSIQEKTKNKKWYCPDCSISMMKQQHQ